MKNFLPTIGSSRDGCIFLIFVFSVLLYLPSVWYGFAYDDAHQIEMNDAVRAPVSSAISLLDPFFLPTYPGDLYRPMAVFSYKVTYHYFGSEPIPYHAVNIILHAICCVLVFILGEAILRRKKPAFIGALLFAAHPAHVEAVANIVGRAELLAAVFGICALLLFDYARRRRTIVTGFLNLFLAGFLLMFAMLSKESAITLLPLIAIYRWLPGIRDQKAWKPWLYWFGLLVLTYAAALVLMLRYAVLNENFFAPAATTFIIENALLSEPFVSRVYPGIILLGKYLALMIVPIHLRADHSQTFDDFWSAVFSFQGFAYAALALLFIYALFKVRKRRFAYFGVWFLCAISIALNIVFPIGTIFGDRLSYLPSVGFCLLIPAAARDLAQYGKYKWLASPLAALLLLVLYTARTVERMPVWLNHRSIFLANIEDSPVSPKSWESLGIYWYHHEKNRVLAEDAFRQAYALNDSSLSSVKYLIDISLAKKDYASAEYWCVKGLQIDPTDIALQVKASQLKATRQAPKNRSPGLKGVAPPNSAHEASHQPEHLALLRATPQR